MRNEKGFTKRSALIAAAFMLVGIIGGGSVRAFGFGKTQYQGQGSNPCNATGSTCNGPQWVRVGEVFAECCCPTVSGWLYKCLCERSEWINTQTGQMCYRSMYEMYEIDYCTDPNQGSGGSCSQ